MGTGERRLSPYGHLDTCFACGRANPHSLGLELSHDGDEAVGHVTFGPQAEGFVGLVHGGALAAVLDDVTGTVPPLVRRARVTAELAVRFRAPVGLGEPIEAHARLERVTDRGHLVHGWLTRVADPKPVTEATARIVPLGDIRDAGARPGS
jgi:acyl-coenzyme A thioesterase PaaI-like protein